MRLPKRYRAHTAEPRILAFWQETGVHAFDNADASRRVYSIDTPPATVSGHLHLGHVYSYSHPDFIARYRRMRGDNVFYPMGFDDNGLPTERLVERWKGVRADEIGREAFIATCLAVSERAEEDYRALWTRMGLSIDWDYTYRTIDTLSRRTSQASFIDLVRKGLAYRKEAPTIWCPECQTAIAQAELDDLDRESTFYALAFGLEGGGTLEIATTRPELLPACVAVFVHPGDVRYAALIGRTATVPRFGHSVPILADPAADPEKGTGAVMCCTFGDTADVAWWYEHDLPLRMAIDVRGCMTALAGDLEGVPVREARRRLVADLAERGLLLGSRPVAQSVRVHERCDTPVEYAVSKQWFFRVLDFKDELIAAGEAVDWHPAHMGDRYREWVEGLSWDWCISRQRTYGVTFPVWYCDTCGSATFADPHALPLDPTVTPAPRACDCGCTNFTPETDVMDTWATSSLTPQIVGKQLSDPELFAKVTPFALRVQAHEIIRTWAFYTIVKSLHHTGEAPWRHAGISGWGLAPEGSGKISKSRGGGPMPPMEMLETHSADAVRYWTASTGFGKDAVISLEKIETGARLVTKLWNVARFTGRFLDEVDTAGVVSDPAYTPADRWILSRCERLVASVTDRLEAYEYAAAKSEVETFFWQDLADNYLEMAKLRLYDAAPETSAGARWALRHCSLTVLKLFAPFLPFVTEEIWQHQFAAEPWTASLHRQAWPEADSQLIDDEADAQGALLLAIATAVRRYKSERAMSLGAELTALDLAGDGAAALAAAAADLRSVTRAREVRIVPALSVGAEVVLSHPDLSVAVLP